jgi:hypothetical protein
MANTITNLTTSNTFLQWLTGTQSIISSLNSLREGGVSNTYVVNTSIEIADNLVVSGNLTVGGFVILDEIGYNDLDVAGNINVLQSIISSNGIFTNLEVLSNIVSINTVSTFNVGTDASVVDLRVSDTLFTDNANVTGSITAPTATLVTPNILINQNIASLNVTTKLEVGTDATIYGNLNAIGNTTLGNVTATFVVIQTANVHNLIGIAETNILNNIFASNAFTSVQNTLLEFATLSCILG